MIIQDDGKIVLGGDFNSFRGTTLQANSPEIARSNTDGTRDLTFIRPFPNNGVNCLEKQFDQKVFAGGLFVRISGRDVYYFGRVNEDGSDDSTFNAVIPTGVTAPVPGGYVNCSALQDDCRIIIGGGFTEVQGITRNRLCRLT
jgi:hypothetical protein